MATAGRDEPGPDAEERFAALAGVFAGAPGVALPTTGRQRRFGAQALTAHGSIFAMLTRGELVVKLPARRVTDLVGLGQGRPFETGQGRVMREWVVVVDPDAWELLAREALAFGDRS